MNQSSKPERGGRKEREVCVTYGNGSDAGTCAELEKGTIAWVGRHERRTLGVIEDGFVGTV
jgi:hypothetical protein